MLVTVLVLSPFGLAALAIGATIVRRAGRLKEAAADEQSY